MQPLPKPLRIIIDESVSEGQVARFRRFADLKKIVVDEHFRIGQHHPGMPDEQIMRHLLGPATLLLTNDRPFHNTALSRKLRSCYVDDSDVTDALLPGIRPKPLLPPKKDDREIKPAYIPETHPLWYAVAPGSEKARERLRTKRRRIRNHFGGLDHLGQIAVTVSLKQLGARSLIGIRVHVSSSIGIKAINGSESYILESVPPAQRSLVALCHGLAVPIRLMMHSVKTLLYCDSARIVAPADGASVEGDLFTAMRGSFPCLEIVAVAKGRHIETLRAKLDQLSRSKTNEIVPGDFAAILEKFKRGPQSPIAFDEDGGEAEDLPF
jgi:hypothetical protein